jgi:heme/copper-type cytochrome/quinol oxidase subunit 3
MASPLSITNSPAWIQNVKKTVRHGFHIVDPSPWPMYTAFSAFFRVFGAVLWRHGFSRGLFVFIFGIISVIMNVTFWWRDVIREATFEGQHTSVVQNGLRMGMILFIVSEIMLFFAFFWAYFHSSLNPAPFIGAVWPPKGIEPMNPWRIPLLNTGLLLSSGAALTWSHAALLGGRLNEATLSRGITLTLAIIFTLFQVFEYLNASFNITDSVYGSTFYRLTGLHGFHVIVGTAFLMVAYFRRTAQQYTVSAHIGYEAAAWYWHFVDVVWIFLFIVVYVWGDDFSHLRVVFLISSDILDFSYSKHNDLIQFFNIKIQKQKWFISELL